MDNYSVRIFLSYEIEADSREEALKRTIEEIVIDLEEGADIEDIADVEVEQLGS